MVKDVLEDKVSLDIESVDRVYLNGYVKDLQMGGGVVNFIREQLDWPIPSPRALGNLTEAYHKAVESYAQVHGLTILKFEKGDDKDAIARARLAEFEPASGVVLIGKAQEKASAFKCRTTHQGKRVWFHYSRQSVYITHYYFYILDEEFGLCFIKVASYLPFEVKVCFNGHERAKQLLRQAGIDFEELSNGFATCEQAEVLQSICHALDAEKIQALFDRWVEQLPWPLNAQQREAGYEHRLSIWQLEVSRTQVFIDAEQGRRLVESLIRENLDLGRPDRVSLLFDKQVTKRTPSEFHTRVLCDGVLPSIRIRYKNSSLKQYFKDGRALRTEMMFNNPYDFGVPRSLENFSRLVALGYEFDRRLLAQEKVSQDSFLPLAEVRQLGESTLTDDGQRASALRFGDPRTMAVLAALTRFSFIPTPLTNKNLRQTIAELLGLPPDQYTQAQMSYDLRRLRLKGLLQRTPHSHRYQLTSLGQKVAIFFTKLYERLFVPGLAALLPTPNHPSPLAQTLDSLDQIVRSWLDNSSLYPDFSVP